jgi:uncharacterized membrane protein
MICESNAHINKEAAKFAQAIIQIALASSKFAVADKLIAKYIVKPTANAICRIVNVIRAVLLRDSLRVYFKANYTYQCRVFALNVYLLFKYTTNYTICQGASLAYAS